jgi:hypothetical protein
MNIMENKRVGLDLENNRYEIIPFIGEHGYEVQVLFNGRPAPWKYSVEINVAADYEKYIGEDAVDSLIRLAKADILEKRFEPLIRMIQER